MPPSGRDDPDAFFAIVLFQFELDAPAGGGMKGLPDEVGGDGQFPPAAVDEDRQTHHLPQDAEQMAALARRVLGQAATESLLGERLQAAQGRVREAYAAFLDGSG